MKHTPGPWLWRINRKTKHIRLVARGFIVMDFWRYGMSSAAPRFRDKNDLMVRADDLAVNIQGEDHHADWNQDIIHPDARLIAAAPDLLNALKWVATQSDWQGGKWGDVELIRHAIEKAEGSTLDAAKE